MRTSIRIVLSYTLTQLRLRRKTARSWGRTKFLLHNYQEHVSGDHVHTWNLDTESIAAERIVNTEGVRKLAPEQIRLTDQDDVMGVGIPHQFANRMARLEGPEAIDAQRLGRTNLAVQNALCLCATASPGGDPVIHLFASWPME